MKHSAALGPVRLGTIEGWLGRVGQPEPGTTGGHTHVNQPGLSCSGAECLESLWCWAKGSSQGEANSTPK